MTGSEFIGPGLGGASLLVSILIWLSSANATRTKDRFDDVARVMRESDTEIKQLIKSGDSDEERRRTEALRDLDARTGKAIDGLRKDIQERIDDLKHTVLAAISHQ